MVSTYNGKITEFNQTGTMLGQLDTTTGSLEGGSIFDTAGNFFVTDHDPQQVMKFDPTGALIGSFGGPYGGQCFQEPSSFLWAIALDPDGTSFWTGDLSTGEVFKLDIATGNILAPPLTPVATT
jgi:outer membrane protein assembly factor BamB